MIPQKCFFLLVIDTVFVSLTSEIDTVLVSVTSENEANPSIITTL